MRERNERISAPTRLFLVRHAKAGDRSRWEGSDIERPLSKKGWAQSAALTERLAGEGVTALISSPSLRCVQTLDPLAQKLDIKIETDERLYEGASVEHSLAVASESPDRAVLCSHGDVIPDLISALARRGMIVATEPDWRKATVWMLDARTEGGERTFIRAAVEPPPKP